jgi:hypothetical protein
VAGIPVECLATPSQAGQRHSHREQH